MPENRAVWNFGQISCLHFSRLACSSSIEMGTVGRWMRLHIKGQGCVILLVSRKSYKLLSIFGPNILLRSKCFFTSWTPNMCVIDCKVCVVLLQKFFYFQILTQSPEKIFESITRLLWNLFYIFFLQEIWFCLPGVGHFLAITRNRKLFRKKYTFGDFDKISTCNHCIHNGI